MSYNTNYLGPQMDANLEKGRNIQSVSSGWIKLSSSTEKPTDLNILKNPGNYTTENWINGPLFPDSFSSFTPLNITVTTINGIEYQFIKLYDTIYMRSYDIDSSSFGVWGVRNYTNGNIVISSTPPSKPIEGETLWLDNTDITQPILYFYTNGQWSPIISNSEMLSSVYDPLGKKIDIFNYIESNMNEKTASVNLSSHITNNEIHTTANEITGWNEKPTLTDLNSLGNSIKENISTITDEKVAAQHEKLDNLNSSINSLSSLNTTTFNPHIADTLKHPISELIDSWNNKSEMIHTHISDDTVKIYVENVSVGGESPIQFNNLSYRVKERAYPIANETTLFNISKNPYHNGDMFYIEADGGITWYFLVNDDLLGTDKKESAFKKFIITERMYADWLDVRELPTTVAGYGITDIVTKDEVASINKKVDEIRGVGNDVIIDKVANTETQYVGCVKLIKCMHTIVDILNQSAELLEDVIA